MRHLTLALAMLLLLAAAPAAAQQGGGVRAPAAEAVDEQEDRPFDLLMQARAELGLSDEQVARLREIAVRLERANQPLRERLQMQTVRFREQRRAELERMTPAERRAELRRVRQEGPPPLPPAMRAVVFRMRQNIAASRREAARVLTPEQKERARVLIQRYRQEHGMGGGMRRPLGRRPLPGRP